MAPDAHDPMPGLALVAWPPRATSEPPPIAGDGIAPVDVDPARGLGAALHAAASDAPGSDVAVVLEPCEIPPGGLRRVQAAARADDAVGAACALVTGGGRPMYAGFDGDPVLDADDGAPRLGGAAIHPRVFALRGPCVVVRGSALQLIGPLPHALTDPAPALAEISARILAAGLSCVVADDVLVRGEPTVAPDDPAAAIDDALETGPLRRALVMARSPGRARSVTIDGRGLSPGASGTQTYMDGLVAALAREGDLAVRVAVRPGAPDDALDRFRVAGAHVDVLGDGDEPPRGHRHTDIAHRPQQVFVAEDLRALRALGERIVVSHLDLIAYRVPGYHAGAADWVRYRAVTRLALAAADAVVFFSRHARDDAVAEELVEADRTALAGVGMDEPANTAEIAMRRPAQVPADAELLVMIGADYRHKNRVFALRVVRELVHVHGWSGILVLAGGHVPHGSSAAEEAELLVADPRLAARVIDLGPVDGAHKQWLLAHAAALIAPSVYEGFGLVPLEAARAGVPCLYAPVTSMTEVIGAAAATLVPWDATASAVAARELLAPGPARKAHVTTLRAALARWRWPEVVEQLHAVYDRALTAPYRPSAARAFAELQREELIVALERARTDLHARVAHGLPLIDEQQALLSHDEQHGLMRLATRPWLRWTVLGPIGRLGAIGPALEVAGPDGPASDARAPDQAGSGQ